MVKIVKTLSLDPETLKVESNVSITIIRYEISLKLGIDNLQHSNTLMKVSKQKEK